MKEEDMNYKIVHKGWDVDESGGEEGGNLKNSICFSSEESSSFSFVERRIVLSFSHIQRILSRE